MRLRAALPLALAALVTVAALPSTAAAEKIFRGKTQQDRRVTLRVGDDDLLDRLRINWYTARCRQSGARFRHFTSTRRPYDESNIDAFRDVFSFTVRDDGGIRSRVRLVLTGTRVTDQAAEAWNGTLSASVVVRRRGRVIDRCRLRQIGWRARLVGG